MSTEIAMTLYKVREGVNWQQEDVALIMTSLYIMSSKQYYVFKSLKKQYIFNQIVSVIKMFYFFVSYTVL